MAKTVVINSVVYSGVPRVEVPLSGGGGNAVFHDTSGADIAPNDVLAGKIGYGASGEVVGTLSTPSVSQDSTTHVLTIS